MNGRENDIDKFLRFLDKHKDSLVIYGSGEAGRVIWDCVSNCLNYTVRFFLDRNRGGECCGLPIYTLDDISGNYGIVIAASPFYEIEKRLEHTNISEWVYMDPVFLNLYCHSKDYISENVEEVNNNSVQINRVCEILCDELSVEIFNEALSQRMNPKLEGIYKFYDPGQYFGNDIVPRVNGNVVDCGAYIGDTLDRYIKQSEGSNWKYYAFEGDANNCEKIREYAASKGVEENVSIYNYAVWDEETMLVFDNPTGTCEMTSGKVDDSKNEGIKVNAARLDYLLLNPDSKVENIDLITMDIEGAEPNAILGAREIIEKWHPMLAISVYHKTSHIWEIPLMIQEIDKRYKLYMRHHRWNIADTVCYGVWSGDE